MIVECQAILALDGTPREASSFLSVGSRYVVMGLAVSPGKDMLVHLVTDDGTLVYARADQFTVVEAAIPKEWQAKVYASGMTDMGHPLLLGPGFLESFFDGDLQATQACRDLVGRVHEEAGMPLPDLWTYERSPS